MITVFKDGRDESYTLTLAGPDSEGSIAVIVDSRMLGTERKITYLCGAAGAREIAAALTAVADEADRRAQTAE
jgi:hypothetical protein